eukprot:8283063-Alexandrium_andersonii.AAC.1
MCIRDSPGPPPKGASGALRRRRLSGGGCGGAVAPPERECRKLLETLRNCCKRLEPVGTR